MKIYLFTLTVLLLFTSLTAGVLTVTDKTRESITVSIDLNDLTINTIDGFSFLEIDGLVSFAEPGAPDVLGKRVYIAIPEDGSIQAIVQERKTEEISLDYPLRPVLANIDVENPQLFEYYVDSDKYQRYRSDIVMINEGFRFRNNYLVPVDIFPIYYDHGTRKILYERNLSISFRILSDNNDRKVEQSKYYRVDNSTKRNIKDGVFREENPDNLINQIVLNPYSASLWRLEDKNEIHYAPFYRSHFWYRFEVKENGIYQLTYNDLSSLPLEDVDPSTIRIFSNGGALMDNPGNGQPFKEIPLYIEGNNVNTFDREDRILFYAENRDGFEKNNVIGNRYYFNPYSLGGVYWLTFGGDFPEPPKRMGITEYYQYDLTKTSAFQKLHFESQNIKYGIIGFDWYQASYSASTTTNHNFSFNLVDLDETKEQLYTISLKSETQNSTTGDSLLHRIRVMINNNIAMERNWLGTGHQIFESSNFFAQEGINSKTLSILRNEFDHIYFDFYSIGYYRKLIKRDGFYMFKTEPSEIDVNVKYMFQGNSEGLRVYEIDNFYTARELVYHVEDTNNLDYFYFIGKGTGETRYVVAEANDYLSVNNFRYENVTDLTKGHNYDGVIITADDFFSQSNQLAGYHMQFYGLSSMVVRQQDIFNQFNSGMPDPMAINIFLKYAVENYSDIGINYAVLVGSGTNDWRNFSGLANNKNKIIVFQHGTDFRKTTSDDFLVYFNQIRYPELNIGRIPVQNVNQMDIYLNKWIQYENYNAPAMWKNTFVILADDEYYRGAASETVHTEDAELIAASINKNIIINKIYGIDFPINQFGKKPEARDEVIRTINDGILVWYYVGHGDPDRLGDEDYFRGTTDLPMIHNNRLNLFIAGSCDVGQYDTYLFDSLAERKVLYPHGASISAIAATRKSTSSGNRALFGSFFPIMLNSRVNPPLALIEAKMAQMNSFTHDRMYNYLGDPVQEILPPQAIEGISFKNLDQSAVNALQYVEIAGDYDENVSGVSIVQAYDTEFEREYSFTNTHGSTITINYSGYGNSYFRGQAATESGIFESAFIVPYDINDGTQGRIIAYLYDETTGKDLINFYYPITQNSTPLPVEPDNEPPTVELWIDGENFRDGDIVSNNPVLLASIFDESGINILGELGHKIFMILNGELPIDVTEGFIYDLGSYQSGYLTWQLGELSEGGHSLQLIVFDNFNNPAVAQTSFVTREGKDIVIENLLPYPNPMKNDGYFTFILNNDANVEISIYTIRGRRIRRISQNNLARGYNQIYWDGRDGDGDRLANNTYFYKVKARCLDGRTSVEEIGKVIIYN